MHLILSAIVGATCSNVSTNLDGHFHNAGLLTSFLVENGTYGTPTSGLTFSVEVGPDGKPVGPLMFDLKNKAYPGSLKVSISDFNLGSGEMKGKFELQNSSGSIIEGVRLDLVGATELYQGKDDAGKDTIKTRAQAVKWASPILFGDIPKNEAGDPCPFGLSGISSKPETIKVSVHFSLSGLAYMGSVNRPETHPIQIDIDAKGRIYIAEVTGFQVLRAEMDGKGMQVFSKLPDQCVGVAVNPKNGDVYATCMNHDELFVFASNGEDKYKLSPEKIGLDNRPYKLRFDRKGTLLADIGGPIVKIVGDKLVQKVETADSEAIAFASGDFESTGALWLASDQSLFKLEPNWTTAKRVAKGPDWHVGRLMGPTACRLDSAGNVYVAEQGIEESEASRVSVFDKNGKIIRMFGRGAKNAVPNSLNDGQVFNPADIGVGIDGRIYVVCGVHGDEGKFILMFMPF